MRGPPRWSLALALAALIAYLTPPSWLERWRLALYDILPATEPAGRPDGPSLADANEALRAQLRLREAEIIRLRTLLDRRRDASAGAGESADGGARPLEDPPKLRWMEAVVVRRADTGDPDTVVLNRGADDGVREGDAVTVDWSLAGVVRQLGRRTCRVWLTSHPNLRVAARLGAPPGAEFEALNVRPVPETESGPPDGPARAAMDAPGRWPIQWQCAVRGEGRGRARVEVHSRMAEAGAGWSVETSGLTGRAPAGLLVGMLSEGLRPYDDGGARAASLRLAVPPEGLRDVVVVGWVRDE